MVHTRAWPRISPSTKIYFRCHFRGVTYPRIRTFDRKTLIPELEHLIEKPLIPELEYLIKKPFHGLFSKLEKNPLKSDPSIEIHEMKLRSTSSVEKNFAEEITWIT